VDAWVTPEDISRARDRFERALGWTRPAAFGVGWVGVDGAPVGEGPGITFARVEVGEHLLPGVVLATVVGHRHGSRSYPMPRSDLELAIDLLTPAEACTAYDHPNLRAWRELHASTAPERQVVAVFAAELDGISTDPYLTRLLEIAAARRPTS